MLKTAHANYIYSLIKWTDNLICGGL